MPASAALSTGGKNELLFSQAMQVQGVSLSQVGFVRRPFGLSVTSLNVGGMERRTSETDNPEGTYSASDLALAASYGRVVGGVALGATGRLIRSEIGGTSAMAFAADLGALKRFEAYPVSVGASLANAGTKLRYLSESYPLPLIFRLGAALGMTKRFPHAVSLQLAFARDSEPVLRLGGEYLGFGPFALRAGLRTTTHEQRQAVMGKDLGSTSSGLSELYGFFIGLGVRSRFGNLDYALVPYGELGEAHRISFCLAFGGTKAAQGAAR
ncbi:MAG: hypothetical protein NTY77_20385 [Elusimicrobia bacterium]|nr:hypothetical protein [Elusimicrobiota bacterium]